MFVSTCSHAHKNTVLLNDKLFLHSQSSGMSCKFCGKAYNRGFNLRRHENEYCPLKGKERKKSETESQTLDLEDGALSVATHVSQSPMKGDSETEEEEVDPWMPMVEKVMQSIRRLFRK